MNAPSVRLLSMEMQGSFTVINAQRYYRLRRQGRQPAVGTFETRDGGATWERQPTGTLASLRAVRFLTPYFGWAVGRVINFGADIYIRQQGGTPVNLFSLPWWLVGGAIGFSILVSLLAGSYPARRAARLNPIEALRHD